MVLLLVGVTALFAAGAFMTWRERGWNWVSISLGAITVIFGLGGIVESLILRIELTDDAMIVTGLKGKRRYEIGAIERIHEARGVAPVLQLRDGTIVRLPSVGSDLGNSVRSWLRQK